MKLHCVLNQFWTAFFKKKQIRCMIWTSDIWSMFVRTLTQRIDLRTVGHDVTSYHNFIPSLNQDHDQEYQGLSLSFFTRVTRSHEVCGCWEEEISLMMIKHMFQNSLHLLIYLSEINQNHLIIDIPTKHFLNEVSCCDCFTYHKWVEPGWTRLSKV